MYFLNPRLAADIFDGEYIIANLDTGLYYSVQGAAVSLLQCLPYSDVNQIIEAFSGTFPENAAMIEEELTSIFRELVSQDVIRQDEGILLENGPEFSAPDAYIPGRFNRYADMQDLLMLDPIHDVDENGWTVQSTNS
ncbi:hypothetical protein [Dyadobacter aurulentus]|uniref:hypothetical protein n=1 Tax=Dyadobacter sp. UC 10 TaxID=2605428 RepID=UPI0011F35339|nr:hypothetical protein [Dyadobacter sp. UC 10]KAA0993489.1 hypothetical protein FXO21_26585 [Dyadobacter sp. UC 10]